MSREAKEKPRKTRGLWTHLFHYPRRWLAAFVMIVAALMDMIDGNDRERRAES